MLFLQNKWLPHKLIMIQPFLHLQLNENEQFTPTVHIK